jgi:cycloeucalenol cycloisomerase
MAIALDHPRFSAETAEHRTFSTQRKWFSANDDKAWAEKFYLCFIPVWLGFNWLYVTMGWFDCGNFWNIAQSVLMWMPYCVFLPLILRRKVALPFYRQYWFKYQLYITVITLILNFYGSQYFYEVLGLRYRFDHVTNYLDPLLVGPSKATRLANHEATPLGEYIETLAFFTCYHVSGIVVIRRIYNAFGSMSVGAKRIVFALAVLASALFWAFTETALFVNPSASALAPVNNWYENIPLMLKIGTWFYALDFLCTFPNLYRLDESPDKAPWSLSRIAIEASSMCMCILLLYEVWVAVFGAYFISR